MKNPKSGSRAGVVFRATFTRNGKVYRAVDYGHTAWPIPFRPKKKGK